MRYLLLVLLVGCVAPVEAPEREEHTDFYTFKPCVDVCDLQLTQCEGVAWSKLEQDD